MRTTRLRLWTAAAAGCVMLLTGTVLAQAATPGSGTLAWSGATTLDWAGSGLTGSAPAVTRLSCQVPTQCDDYALTINTKKGATTDPNSLAEVRVTPSSGASMYLIVYPPGSSPGDPTNTNYNKTGLDWRALNPPNGTYTIRVVCQTCTGASYSAHATLTDSSAAAQLPPAGSGAIKWAVTKLAGKDAQGNDVQYGEPGIWFNSKGEGIANTFGPTVWITKDNGKTWTVPYNLFPQDTCTVESGDADAVVANDGTFYADDLCVGGVGGAANDMFVNQAGGDPGKWTGPNYGGFNVDRNWATPDNAHPGTIYLEYHDFEGPNINVLKSTDYGVTWICPVTGLPEHTCPITATNNSNTGFLDTGAGNTTAKLLIDPTDSNRLYVAYADNCFLNSELTPPTANDFDLDRIHLAVSTDGGATWSANADTAGQTPVLDANAVFGGTPCSTVPPTGPTCDNTISHTFPTDAIDSKGNLYIVFSMRKCNETQTHLYLTASADRGVHWTHPTQVDQGGIDSNLMEWLAAGDPGRLAISWYGSPARDFNDTAAEWSEMYSVSTNALSSAPTFIQSRVSGAKSVHSADICEAGTDCLVTGGNRDLADYQGVAVDSCGFAHPIWTDDSTGVGVTMTARQTAGPNLFNVNPCAAKAAPFTMGTGFSNSGVVAGAAIAGAGALLLLAVGGLAWRRRQR